MADPLMTRNLAQAPGGSSGVRIMADADGRQYFVKFKENGHFLKALTNEYVAGKIAERLGLPVPQAHIVYIDPLLVPTLQPINHTPVSAGPHFATCALENVYAGPLLKSYIARCVNKSIYPLIILFDALLYNCDRRLQGNFVITTSSSTYTFNIIDHGFCFGTNWDCEILRTVQGRWSDAYLPEMYATIQDATDFNNALQLIAAITDDFFINLVEQIPEDWLPDQKERKALIQFLILQRNSISTMLSANLHKFPNLLQP